VENLVAGEINVTKDLGEQSRSDRLACMDRNYGDAPVDMPEQTVASPLAEDHEAAPFERADKLGARHPQRRH
jgi:hypothetical protein